MSSLVVDGSSGSWARPFVAEAVLRSSLQADSYSSNPSIAEGCAPAAPEAPAAPGGAQVDVPVIIDVGPIAATAADVQASVNGERGHKVASCGSVRVFENRRTLEELSSRISSAASSAHSQSLMSQQGLHSLESMPASGGGRVGGCGPPSAAAVNLHGAPIAQPRSVEGAEFRSVAEGSVGPISGGS